MNHVVAEGPTQILGQEDKYADLVCDVLGQR